MRNKSVFLGKTSGLFSGFPNFFCKWLNKYFVTKEINLLFLNLKGLDNTDKNIDLMALLLILFILLLVHRIIDPAIKHSRPCYLV